MALTQALREFEYQAHYLNLLELLGEQLDLAEIAIQAASGPDNWARARLAPLSEPDAAGHTHRITLAFDTRLVTEAEGGEQLGLSAADAQNGVSFALAWHNYELGTANGPLLRLHVDGNNGKFLLYPEEGGAAEVVRPESDVALTDSLALLANQWLPLPVLRCTSGRRFIGYCQL
ncbi:hypothetical protein CRX72_17030 [Pantoea sp. BRM17]|nr:hypothetical protein CRX72_17030 [Pantoea sp. BRM17]